MSDIKSTTINNEKFEGQYLHFANYFHQTVDSTKKISRNMLTEDDWFWFLSLLDNINASDRFAKRFGNLPFTEIEMPEVLKAFILPDSVTVNGDDDSKDVLVRPHCGVVVNQVDEARLRQFASKLYGMFRKDAEFIPVSESRISSTYCNLENIKVFAPDFNVCCTLEPNVLPVTISIPLLEDFKYNMELERQIQRYISNLFNNFA